jgi:NAD+ synthase (glutamine-hydrolysing)
LTRVRLGTAFLNQTPLAWDANFAHISSALDLARERGTALLCLPELALTGYGCEDLFLAPFVREKALELLAALLPRTRGLFTAFGLPLEVGAGVYNALAVCADGRLLGVVPKQQLALDGLHYEPRWFRAWPAGAVVRRRVLGSEVAVGDLVFGLGAVRVGFEICEDAWVAAGRPASSLAARGANLIFCPAASHFAFGKTRVRRGLSAVAAKEHGLAYVYSNLMGNESGRAIFDGGAHVLDARGSLVAEGERFSFRDFGMADAVVELPPPGPELPGLVQAAFTAPEAGEPPAPARPDLQAWEEDPNEEFARAVGLGLFDYLRKSRARGFALSLSGGADSAACAVLVRFMAGFASAQLGFEAFAQRLPEVPGLGAAGGLDAAMALLLRTLYQASANSSGVTRSAASAVAAAVGSSHSAVEIQHLVDAYRGLAEGVLGRTLNWADDDLTLQNLQARVRSPGVWALANAEGRLLLATNNRSEAAAGYTTMDGDTSGGLAPVSGVGKHFLRQWLRWAETRGPEGLGAFPALKAVNDQDPTAELRPLEDGQTDEGDLMPYSVLDALEHAAVAGRQPPEQAYQGLLAALPGEDPVRLREWTRRFYRLWAHAQWKRERLAVGFHVDDHNVDPRSWCRWPVLNGGFESELKDLR